MCNRSPTQTKTTLVRTLSGAGGEWICLWPPVGVFLVQMCLIFSVAFCCISTRLSLYAWSAVLHSISNVWSVGTAVSLTTAQCSVRQSGSHERITVGELRTQPLLPVTAFCRTAKKSGNTSMKGQEPSYGYYGFKQNITR